MKLNTITILIFLLGSIFAQNMNMDFAQSFEQDWIKRDIDADPQGLNEVKKVNMFGYECKGNVKKSFIRWKWVLNAEWKCPDLTSIVGYSVSYNSKKVALESALNDFMSKIVKEYAKKSEKLKS